MDRFAKPRKRTPQILYNQIRMRLLYLILILNFLGLPAVVRGQTDTTYLRQFERWHKQREASLVAEDGWINLAGRFVLEKGLSTFGAHKTNQVVFPSGLCADFLGAFLLKNDSVWVEPHAASGITLDGHPIGVTTLLFPASTPQILHIGSLRCFVIQRGPQFIVRLRDLEHPLLKEFHGVPTYPLDTTWRVTAQLEQNTTGSIAITNVLGITTNYPTVGTLVFTLQGQTCRLTPITEGNQLFLIFADETSGRTTYGSGRFLYADLPDTSGKTVLDFNYAINPPCAFTEFASCPLPPRQNALPIFVTAGEKSTH
jgi:uncharacterized protein